jgi:predicted phage terminase large subunit-like protein
LLVCDALERVDSGECKRLIIAMPPRHGKSMLTSEYFPAWYLGRKPSRSIIASSYSQELAEDFGRKVRGQVTDHLWGQVFPSASIMQGSASASRIDTGQGGHYYAVGVGGAVTGRGADLLLIDDPVKGREDADSETMRRRQKDWYRSVAYTRLMPGGAIVMVLTRWHEDDLAGWCLAEHEGEGWEVLSLPALAEPGDILGREVGDALWPDRYPVAVLAGIRSVLGQREWAALYQQRPAPDEGAYFQREWLQTYDGLPSGLRMFGASDYAVSANGGDYTVHVVAGVDDADDIYLLDLWREQSDALGWVESWLSMLRIWAPQAWAEEAGVIAKTVAPVLTKRLQEERLYRTLRKPYPSTTDKASRARGLQARMQAGKVFFPSHQDKPWVLDLVSEMLTFPAGKHDDQVDALSLLCRLLDDIAPRRADNIPRQARAICRL